MTVGKNIRYPLKRWKWSQEDQDIRVKEMLDLIQLPGLEERFPRQLSGGQQQRVALARALAFRPRFLLMDEPLGALDKKLREHMQIELKKIHKDLNITVIYVTHDQSEALNMSDTIAVLNEGHLEQVGAVDAAGVSQGDASHISQNLSQLLLLLAGAALRRAIA